MATFLQIRKYFIFGSQLSGSLICIYFIFDVQQYEVSWSLLPWLMPTVASNINSFLGTIHIFG